MKNAILSDGAMLGSLSGALMAYLYQLPVLWGTALGLLTGIAMALVYVMSWELFVGRLD